MKSLPSFLTAAFCLLLLPAFSQSQSAVLLDSIYIRTWDQSANDWQRTYRLVFSYNIEGKEIQKLTYHWDTADSTWKAANKFETVYNLDGSKVERVQFHRNIVTNNWDLSNRETYTYTGGTQPEEVIFYYWNTNANNWQQTGKSVTTYNSSGKETEVVVYKRDALAGIWIELSRTVNTYNENEELEEKIEFNWKPEINDWLPYSRHTKTYSFNGTIETTEELGFNWNNSAGNWVETSRSYSTHEVTGNMAENVYHGWLESDNAWTPSMREIYIYDALNNPEHYFFYMWDNNWQPSDVWDYYWSEHTLVSGIAQSNLLQYLISPNPVTDILTISGLTDATYASVYTSNGKLVQTALLDNITHSMDIHRLPAGVYFLHLKAGGRAVVRQVVKE